ncbi:MAG: transposase [Xanthobacteraceae bacterium]
MTRKRHSPEEIAGKLRQAHELTESGRRQGEIARALGVSVMTYHRWRKARPDLMNGTHSVLSARALPGPARSHDLRDTHDIVRLDELRLENERLRRLVTNLLLEKVRLEEMLERRSAVGHNDNPPR